MFLCTNKIPKHDTRRLSTIASRALTSNARPYSSSRNCTQIRPCQFSVSHSPASDRFAKWHPSRTFRKDNVRFSHSFRKLDNRSYVALGSNMGDRVAMIEQACREMDATGDVKVLRTSSLYESKAMYVVDQDNFVNGACEVIRNTSCDNALLTTPDSNIAASPRITRLPPVGREQDGPRQSHRQRTEEHRS
jgi:2-amino-4-hydroxy-6-hydroxymethyldihydropteridine diphosphokinase